MLRYMLDADSTFLWLIRLYCFKISVMLTSANVKSNQSLTFDILILKYISDIFKFAPINNKKGGNMEEIKKETAKMQVNRDNIYAILAYLWVLCLIPVLMKKDDPFVKFHARQGLMLFIVEVALGIVGIVPFLGVLISQIGGLVCLVVSIIGIIQVLKGNQWKIPYLGEWAEKLINI